MHPMGASVIGAPVAAQVAPTAAQGVPPVVYEAVSSDDEVAIPMDSLLIGGEDPHGLYQGELSPATEAGLQDVAAVLLDYTGKSSNLLSNYYKVHYTCHNCLS